MRLNQKKTQKAKWLTAARQVQENYSNYIYTASLWMGRGRSKQEMRVNFDTGSDWFAVETKDCDTCVRNTYDP